MSQTSFVQVPKAIKSCENTTGVKFYLQIPEYLFLPAVFGSLYLLILQERD